MKIILKLIFVTAIAIFTAFDARACWCDNMPKLDSNYVKNTPYIALIKVKKILDSSFNKEQINYQIAVDEIIRFKGDKRKTLLVLGGSRKLGISTSCDLGVEEGQEWVVFGNMEQYNIPVMHSCDQTTMYREADGLRNWSNQSGFRELNFLQKYFNKLPPTHTIVNGIATEQYNNGQTEYRENYKNGKKDGTAHYYYPDGEILCSVNYKEGKLSGKTIWYYPDGIVEKKDVYKNGLKKDTSADYLKTGEPIGYTIYLKPGIIKKTMFYQGDNKRFLWVEGFYEHNKTIKRIYYNEDDNTIKSIIKYLPNGRMEEQYNSSGKVTETRYYDNHGKLVTANKI